MSRVTTSYCIRATALAIAAVAGAASAQQVPAAAPSKFVVFMRTAPVGSDEVAVTRGAGGWTIASTGSLGAPLDLVTRNLQIRYDPDWKPLEVTIDGTLRGQAFGLHITVNGDHGDRACEQRRPGDRQQPVPSLRTRCSFPTHSLRPSKP